MKKRLLIVIMTIFSFNLFADWVTYKDNRGTKDKTIISQNLEGSKDITSICYSSNSLQIWSPNFIFKSISINDISLTVESYSKNIIEIEPRITSECILLFTGVDVKKIAEIFNEGKIISLIIKLKNKKYKLKLNCSGFKEACKKYEITN